ncbi:MAG: DUF817 domain-containing protein [Pseudomonadota bacterium]
MSETTRPAKLTLERQLGDWMRSRLPGPLAEFIMFGLKQGWACLFGGLMLMLLIGTHLVWQEEWPVARYDFLFVAAIAIQIAFLTYGLESLAEARVILLFHITGTVMEVFKIHMGSWSYPEPGLIKLYDVPLFSGFMYASVGSYIARVIRLFDMRFTGFPPRGMLTLLAGLIYINFFTHHFGPDIRWALMLATLLLFAPARVWFTISARALWMPLVLAAALATFFLYVAESIGTATGTWIYRGQTTFTLAPLSKAGAWYLLLWVSFAQVLIVFDSVVIRRAPSNPRSKDIP